MENENQRPERRQGLLCITLGLLLIAAALFLAAYNLYDGLRAGRDACRAADVLAEQAAQALLPQQETPDYLLFPDMEMPEQTVDGVAYIGVLHIPALELELPVASRWSYPTLKTSPCRYSGSAYRDDLVICAHNYAAHFGGLGELQPGDTATFTDVEGNVFRYRMAEREILPPTAVDEMEAGGWGLTLFTCTIGGQSRVTVRFERAEDDALPE